MALKNFLMVVNILRGVRSSQLAAGNGIGVLI